jgi:hypothetical protein
MVPIPAPLSAVVVLEVDGTVVPVTAPGVVDVGPTGTVGGILVDVVAGPAEVADVLVLVVVIVWRPFTSGGLNIMSL